MPKVILQISYEINPDRRSEYLSLAKEMKEYFGKTQNKNYEVYEVKGKSNFFIEQFSCESMEEYDALEDNMDERGEELVNRLEKFLKNGKAKYATLIGQDN